MLAAVSLPCLRLHRHILSFCTALQEKILQFICTIVMETAAPGMVSEYKRNCWMCNNYFPPVTAPIGEIRITGPTLCKCWAVLTEFIGITTELFDNFYLIHLKKKALYKAGTYLKL
jgi:hypothetical protein